MVPIATSKMTTLSLTLRFQSQNVPQLLPGSDQKSHSADFMSNTAFYQWFKKPNLEGFFLQTAVTEEEAK